MHENVIRRVWELIDPLATAEGLEVVDVEFRRENRGAVLRLFLDRDGGVTLDDLTRVSRQVSDVLDVHEAVPGKYTLEVSSPGINRRLRRPDHFARFVGGQVRVRTVVPLDGRRTFLGTLSGVASGGITVAQEDGEHFIAFEQISQANYEARP